MAQVIFLPGWRQTSDEEWVRLDAIQEALSLFHINFEYEYKGFPEYDKKELKAAVHFKIRQSMTVVKK